MARRETAEKKKTASRPKPELTQPGAVLYRSQSSMAESMETFIAKLRRE